MLDKNALSQLQSLKQEIRNSVPRFSGRVRATAGRYGFVNTDEGQSYFLAPDEMDKVLPGDTIEFRVEMTSDNKEQAIIEKLVSTEIQELYGTYIVRGKGHFIESDHQQLKRWLFVPPQKRKNAKEGDFVKAHISQHPFPSGKTQADIDSIIGNINDAGIEQLFTLTKWGLPQQYSVEALAQAKTLQEQGLSDILAQRTDLTHLPLVTIDSASTRDLDDALFAEAQSDGWTLWIAIADPSAVIPVASPIDHEAEARSTSCYFPELVLPMLPSEVSEHLCSLQAMQTRPALVVELRIGEKGEIRHTHIHQAIVTSHAKLSYTQVAQFINGEADDLISAELQGPLLHLNDCAQALSQWRHQHALVMEERPDFKLVMDSQGKVQDILCLERTVAHRIVEECMLACNLAVATWLAEHDSGFFIEHSGVRPERLETVQQLLQEELALDAPAELTQLNDYIHVLQQAEHSQSIFPLRSIVARQQDRSNFSLEAKPHFGLGFKYYTTFTSPLRKYNDLLIHRIVKSILNNDAVHLPSEITLQELQQRQTNARNASWQAETWLKLDWLNKHEPKMLHEAQIIHITPNAINVRLVDNGIEGSVDRRREKGWEYNQKTLSLHKEEKSFLLGQTVYVEVAHIEARERLAQFTLTELPPVLLP